VPPCELTVNEFKTFVCLHPVVGPEKILTQAYHLSGGISSIYSQKIE
jgi:hypothetical protein